MTSFRDLERQLLTGRLSVGSQPPLTAPELLVPAPDDQDTVDDAALMKLRGLQSTATRVIDLLDATLLELMLVDDPAIKYRPDPETTFATFREQYLRGRDPDAVGTWVAFGDGTLVHFPYQRDFYRLRTSRNRGLISAAEQERISTARIVVAGLSVGGASATALAMEGFRDFYITDTDVLSVSNLNRLISSAEHVGRVKTDITADRIWRIDPFSRITRDNRGYSPDVEDTVFSEAWMPDVFVDAMDSIEGKLAARASCQKFGVPLIWMADIGDGVVKIGCERYDRDRTIRPFHGRLEHEHNRLGRDLTYEEGIVAMVGNEYADDQMRQLFGQACQGQIPGVPQLAGTVSVSAGMIARAVRRIVRGESIQPDFAVRVGDEMDAVVEIRFKPGEIGHTADRDVRLPSLELGTFDEAKLWELARTGWDSVQSGEVATAWRQTTMETRAQEVRRVQAILARAGVGDVASIRLHGGESGASVRDQIATQWRALADEHPELRQLSFPVIHDMLEQVAKIADSA